MIRIVIAAALLLGLSAGGLAGQARVQVSISPFAGGMIYDGSLMIHEGGEFVDHGIEGDPPRGVLGLRVGLEATERLGLEGSYGRSWLGNTRGDLASHLYHATVRYSILATEAWSLHLALGGGGITYEQKDAQPSSISDPIVAGGAGIFYRLSPVLDLRTDLLFFGQFCNEPARSDGLVCNRGSQLGYTQLAAGIRFRP